jgi:hypothetical protein
MEVCGDKDNLIGTFWNYKCSWPTGSIPELKLMLWASEIISTFIQR